MKFGPDDLLTTCPACGGTGLPPNVSPAEAEQKKLIGSSGTQYHGLLAATPKCAACNGVGRIPTASGQAIITLLDIARQQGR